MIKSKDECYLQSSCKKFCKGACGESEAVYCPRLSKIDYLYNEALIPIKQRKRFPLRVDADGTDKAEFTQLKNAAINIEKFIESGANLFIYSQNCGNGKAQPDDALILTDNGYVRMVDIQEGQLIYGEDGQLHKIIGKYDRGIKSIYKVTFNDRTSTECCDEHLWNISDRCSKDKSFKTIALRSIIGKSLHRHKNHGWRYQIPITKALSYTEHDHIIHPYILGCLLGDGCFGRNSTPTLTIHDDYLDIAERIKQYLPENVTLNKITYSDYGYILNSSDCKFGKKLKDEQVVNIIKKALKDLALIDTKSLTKFIPNEYLFDSVENRIHLLQGLMDTDGTVLTNTNNLSYSSSSLKLAEDFKFLVQSLGGTVTISHKTNITYRYKRHGIDEYRKAADTYYCQVKLPSNIQPFSTKKKSDKYSNAQQNEPYRSIHNIEYIGEKHCYCIMTDNPSHLYLTNDCIVTHNTSWGIRLIQAHLENIWYKTDLRCRALFISVPRYLLAIKNNISKTDEYAEHINKNIFDADIVVFDDIATKGITQFEAENLFSIIDTRMNMGKSNIFTSNIIPSQLNELLGPRLTSRIINLSTVIQFRGRDKRGIQ